MSGAGKGGTAAALCLFAWGMVAVTFAFLIENWLMFWHGWAPARGFPDPASWPLAGLYALALALAAAWALTGAGPLRTEARRISTLSAFIVRAAFWAVVLVGLADAAISFLRIEGFLVRLVGEDLNAQLGLARGRAPLVHLPLIALGVVVAALTRGTSFIWLALLVVAAELTLVISRFVFSYEQAFMSDLVRFWYSALFLLASAHTLLQDGHVRVDVLYAGMSRRAKALVNGIGAVVFGMSLCWLILILGTAGPASTLNAPILRLEVGQQASGMFVRYLMAGFLGLFAVTMLLQFCAMVLSAAADWRDEPAGAPAPSPVAGH